MLAEEGVSDVGFMPGLDQNAIGGEMGNVTVVYACSKRVYD